MPTTDGLKNRHGDHELVLGRTQLNAPPDLQFVDIGVGTRISVEGYDPVQVLRFELPQPAFFWRVHTGLREHRVAPKLAAVQLRPNEQRVTCLYRTRLFAPLIAREIREAFQEPAVESDSFRHLSERAQA